MLLNGKVFTRRVIRVERPCTFCTKPLLKGSLSWQRNHIALHVKCFERLKKG